MKSNNNTSETSRKRFKKSLLAVSIMAMSVPAFAQTAAQDDNLEEVVVTGMRNSLDTAQELKRNADTVKDVITASDIGALPDKSVTEALQRVPGVTIERFASSSDPKHYADEGTGVLVRGLDRVRSEINGRDAFSANPWGGLSYEDFPAELLGAVEVVKNQTADLISGGIAGTVNLITRKPFDSDERLLSFNAKANYGDLREELTPSFSGLFADTWETSAGKFGFLISGSNSTYKTQGDGVGLGNYHSRGVLDTFSYDAWGTPSPGVVSGLYPNPCIPGSPDWRSCENMGFPDMDPYTPEDQAAYVPEYDGEALEGQPEGVTWYAPANYHISTAENDRRREGFTTSLQWANADETITATVEHINSEASLEYRERVIASGDRGFLSYVPNTIQWFDEPEDGQPLTIEDGFVTSGVGIQNNPEMPLQFRTRYNYNENTVEDTSFNIELKPTDRLTVAMDYQHVESEQIVHNYGLTSRINGNQTATNAPFFMDLRGDVPSFEYLNENVSYPADVALPQPHRGLDANGNVRVDGSGNPIVDANGNPVPGVDYTNPILRLASGMQQEVHNTAKADSVKLDVQYEFDGVFTAIKAGVYYSEKELNVADTEYEGWQALGTPWSAEGSYNASPQAAGYLYERVNFADVFDGKAVKGDYNSFLFPKMDLAKNYIQTLREGCGGWSATGNAMDGSGGCAVPYEDLADRVDSHFAARHMSSTEEERTEFYVRGDFHFEDLAIPIKGNVGLRYVGYQLQSTGSVTLPATSRRGTDPESSLYQVMEQDYPELFALASGEAITSTVDGTDYDTVLPSLNLAFSVTDDVVVRFGASKGLYYPTLVDARNSMVVSLDYTEVFEYSDQELNEDTNPVIGLTDVEISANARNAYLEPEESINYDLTTEWYFATAGSIAVGLFQKDLDNIIRNKSFPVELDYAGTTYPVSAYGPDNTGSGTIRGIEFSYSQFYDMLPGAWSGLGLQFNYTYIDQNGLEDPNTNPAQGLTYTGAGDPIVDNRNSFRIFTGLPLQGYSDQNMNIVGMYEYDAISFRLAYTWRSEYMLTLRESEEFVPAYADDSGMMDASLYYTINDNWKVGLEASNILNETTETMYQMNQEGYKTDALNFTTDRRYALSVRATF